MITRRGAPAPTVRRRTPGSVSFCMVVCASVVASGCTGTAEPTTPTASDSTPSTSVATTSTEPTTTSLIPTTAPPTTTAPITKGFSIPLGVDGVTFDFDGSPPSGPTSFAFLDDGSVVVADTMAFARDEPRLLVYEPGGTLDRIIDLRPSEVASVVDVATDGERLAVLDVWIAGGRYRLLIMDPFGEVESVVDIPPGFRFEDGLTGLVWDDEGILLEFRLGDGYARLDGDRFVGGAELIIGGHPITLIQGDGTVTTVQVGPASFTVDRATDLGGAQLVGVAPDGSIVLVIDEVSFADDGAFQVLRRVERFLSTGEPAWATVLDAADQALDIPRPFELAPDGSIAYLHATPDSLDVVILDQA